MSGENERPITMKSADPLRTAMRDELGRRIVAGATSLLPTFAIAGAIAYVATSVPTLVRDSANAVRARLRWPWGKRAGAEDVLEGEIVEEPSRAPRPGASSSGPALTSGHLPPSPEILRAARRARYLRTRRPMAG